VRGEVDGMRTINLYPGDTCVLEGPNGRGAQARVVALYPPDTDEAELERERCIPIAAKLMHVMATDGTEAWPCVDCLRAMRSALEP
jgi:hypothetical protein